MRVKIPTVDLMDEIKEQEAKEAKKRAKSLANATAPKPGVISMTFELPPNRKAKVTVELDVEETDAKRLKQIPVQQSDSSEATKIPTAVDGPSSQGLATPYLEIFKAWLQAREQEQQEGAKENPKEAPLKGMAHVPAAEDHDEPPGVNSNNKDVPPSKAAVIEKEPVPLIFGTVECEAEEKRRRGFFGSSIFNPTT